MFTPSSTSVKSYAIQFTGEDANIYKIEEIAKINYKTCKIHRTKDNYFSLKCLYINKKGLNISSNFSNYIVYIGDWVPIISFSSANLILHCFIDLFSVSGCIFLNFPIILLTIFFITFLKFTELKTVTAV
jgi:hypothetical protein